MFFKKVGVNLNNDSPDSKLISPLQERKQKKKREKKENFPPTSECVPKN